MIEIMGISVLALVALCGFTVGLAVAPKPSSPPPQRQGE